MSVNQLVLFHGIRDTRGALARWNANPWPVLRALAGKWVHEKARPITLGWVVAVTAFSLATQAYALGLTGGQLAGQLGISPALLVVTVLPHAVPELVALFLPLAAWTIASRRDEWRDLLAATFATVGVAVPILIAAATWETYIWPRILAAVSPLY